MSRHRSTITDGENRMASVRLTYKIVVDPKTFEFIVMEMQIHKDGDAQWLDKRRIEKEELETWTKDEFVERLSEYGYESAARSYLERYAINFSCGQQP